MLRCLWNAFSYILREVYKEYFQKVTFYKASYEELHEGYSASLKSFLRWVTIFKGGVTTLYYTSQTAAGEPPVTHGINWQVDGDAVSQLTARYFTHSAQTFTPKLGPWQAALRRTPAELTEFNNPCILNDLGILVGSTCTDGYSKLPFKDAEIFPRLKLATEVFPENFL